MQNVVDSGPPKGAFGRKMSKTRHGLIEIDQPETDVKRPDARFVVYVDEYQPGHTEKNMENIVGRSPAREALVLCNNKSEDADDDQQRCKDKQYVIIQVFHAI